MNENISSILSNCDDNPKSQKIYEGAKSTFLSMLVRCAEAKTDYKKGRFSYENVLKQFSAYIFIVDGRILYETLAANLPLPSVSTVCRYTG